MDDFSVVNARDPSITGWRRPQPDRNLVVKDLLSIFEAEEARISSAKHHLKVYLRLKPFLSKDGGSSPGSFTILDEHTLSTCAPPESITFKNQGQNVTHQYKFTKIFGPESTQKEIFDECVSEHVTDFVIGNNSLVFAYGTTNAGKTFTVQGNPREPGIVPRSLDLLFKRIHGKESHIGRYKPEKVDEIIELDNESIARDAAHKNMILQWDWEKHQHSEVTRDGDDLYSSASSDFVSNAFREMQKTISEEMVSMDDHREGDAVFSVWVSYVEIYNDYIYDLLEPAHGIGAKRVPLKLGLDSNGNVYIRDIRQIHVASGDEAFQVMVYGKKHLQVAATNMNSSSSRSHSVFTVKLVRYVNTEESPTHARVSCISFCDLAGAERVKKTLNVGDRLKESTNINASLHFLGRCLATIKENQSSKFKKQVPYRESKLTRLFQRALQGHDRVTMVVNLNLSQVLYDESVHVLKFSAIAKQIVLQTPIKRARREENNKNKSRFSSLALRPSKSICWENPSDDEIENRSSTVVDELTAKNEALLEQLTKLHEELREEKRKNLSIESNLRITLTDQFTEILQKKEKSWRDRLRALEERTEEMSTWRINQLETYYEDLLHKKRRRTSTGRLDDSSKQDQDEDERTFTDNKAVAMELEEAKQRIKDMEEALALEKNNSESLKLSLQDSRRERNELATLNSQLKFSLAHTENVMKNNQNLLEAASSEEYVEELKKQLVEERAVVTAKTEKIEYLNSLLDGAREDYVLVNQEKEAAETEVDVLRKDVAERMEEVSDLKSKVAELEAVRLELADSVTSFEQKEMDISEYEDIIKSLKKELSQTKSEYPRKIKELEDQLQSLSVKESTGIDLQEFEDVRTELQHVRKELQEAQSKLSHYEEMKNLLTQQDGSVEEKEARINSLIENISSLKEELRKSLEDHEEEIRKLKEDHGEEIRKLKDAHEEDVRKLKDAHEEGIRKLKDAHEEDVRKLKDAHEEGVRKLKDVHEEDVRKLKDSHEEDVRKLKDAHEEGIRKLKDAHEEDVRKLNDIHEEGVRKLEEVHKGGIRRMKDVHKEDIRKLEGRHEEDIQKLKDIHEEDFQKLEDVYRENNEKELLKFSKEHQRYKEEIRSMQSTLKEMERLLQERQSEIEELSRWKLNHKEAMAKELSERDRKHELEVQAVQSDLKKSLQRTIKLEENARKLEEDLKKSHEDSARMEKEVKNALQQSHNAERTSTSAELVKMLSAAREEAKDLKAELQKVLDDKKLFEAALLDKDKEMETFKGHRDELVTRYENQFRKFQEESERDKKEIATLTATLYKNTPTPNKKQYEAEIFRLKEQIEVLKDNKNVGNRTENSSSIVDVGKSLEEVNGSKRRGAVKKSTASSKSSQSMKGSTEDISQSSGDFLEPPKAARRARRKNTGETVESNNENNFTVPAAPLTSALLSPIPAEEESESSARLSVRRTNRKKLYAPPNADNFNSENTDPIAFQVEPATPEVFVKSLRSRSRRI